MIENMRLSWPWIASVPLLLGGFACSVFFLGTDSVLLAPFILCLLAYAGIALYPNVTAGWSVPRSHTFLAVMLFWGWMVLNLFLSTTPFISTTFTIILSILPVFLAVNVMAREPGRWTTVHAGALFTALAGFAVWALIQYFFFFKQYGPRIHHPMLNPNNLAGLFNLGIFPAMALFVASKGRRAVLLSGLLVAVFYGALIVTQSRGAFLAWGASALVFVPAVLLKNPEGRPWKRLAFLAAMAVLIPFLCDLRNAGAIIDERAITNVRSAEDRFYLWASTWAMIKDHFWTGTGLASFYFYYPRYRSLSDRSDGFFAHMDPLQFWAEMGVLAPILFYGILVCVLLRTFLSLRAAGGDIRTRMAIMGSFCGMLALVGHTHITFHLYMPGMLLPLSGLLSFWYMATERALGKADQRFLWVPRGRMRLAAVVVPVVLALIVGGWTVRTSSATWMMGQVQKEAARKHTEEAAKKLYLAGLIAPGSYSRYPEYEARFRAARLLDNAKDKKMPVEDVRKLYDETMAYLDRAERLNPAFTVIWDLRARVYYAVDGILINDGRSQAIALLTKAIEANPLAAESRVALSNVYAQGGDLKKAEKVLEDGVKWPRMKGSGDVSFLVALAGIKLRLGDTKAGQMYMQEAQKRAQRYGMAVRKP